MSRSSGCCVVGPCAGGPGHVARTTSGGRPGWRRAQTSARPTARCRRPRTSATARRRRAAPVGARVTIGPSSAQPPQELLLVDDVDAELAARSQLRAGTLARHHEVGLLPHAGRHPRARRLRRLGRLLPRKRLEAAGQHDGLPVSGLGPVPRPGSAVRTPAARSFSISAGSARRRTTRGRSRRSPGRSRHRVDLVLGRRHRARRSSGTPARAPARRARRRGGCSARPAAARAAGPSTPRSLEEVRDRLVLEPRELRQLLGVERVDVGRVLDQPPVEQQHPVL